VIHPQPRPGERGCGSTFGGVRQGRQFWGYAIMGRQQLTRPFFVCTTAFVMLLAAFPLREASCFWDEDSLKITGITIGSILALGIIVVLVAGTIEDLKGGDREEGRDLRDQDHFACAREPDGATRAVNPYVTSQCVFFDPDKADLRFSGTSNENARPDN
jgi:hypothetical protein